MAYVWRCAIDDARVASCARARQQTLRRARACVEAAIALLRERTTKTLRPVDVVLLLAQRSYVQPYVRSARRRSVR